MLDTIRRLFTAEEPEADNGAALHLAAAVLLVEVAKSDHSLEGLEIDRIKDALVRDWALGTDDLADLLQVARDTSDNGVSLHREIDLINQRFSTEQKLALMRSLWEVACADGEVHHYEEALIRRLADLIYLPHKDFIRSKHLALDTQ